MERKPEFWSTASPRERSKISGFLTVRAGKAGNPFQTTQGNRLSCRDQEGRRGSEEAVPECNVGDLGSIPGLGRSPGERKGYPLQYSCLENSGTEKPNRRLQSLVSQRVRHD